MPKSTLRHLISGEHEAIDDYDEAQDKDPQNKGLYDHIGGEEEEHADELVKRLNQPAENEHHTFMGGGKKKPTPRQRFI
jgi:hypothetical protein